MNTDLLNIVKQIVAKHGESILANPQKLKPLVADYAKAESKMDRVAFGRAIENGFYMELKRSSPADRMRVKATLVPRLQTITGFDARCCTAAVDLLEAVIFSLTQPAPPQQPRPPQPAGQVSPQPWDNQTHYTPSQMNTHPDTFCGKCGTQLSGGSQFCSRCGHTQSSANGQTAIYPPGYSPANKIAALLFCIFLSGFGVHRFYTGKVGSGIGMLVLYLFFCIFYVAFLFTGDEMLLFIFILPMIAHSIWALVDLVRIATNKFTDARGFPLKKD